MSGRFEPSKMKRRLVIGAFGLLLVGLLLGVAFRSLRASVLLSTADHPPGSLLITSTQPGEGKTTVATNLAISLAQLGQRVLLVDADLRFPSLQRLFCIRENLGLVSYLTGQEDWRTAVCPSGSPGLDLLPCGPVPPNPAELLSSKSMGAFLGSAKSEYAFVILDSSPLLMLADSRILAELGYVPIENIVGRARMVFLSMGDLALASIDALDEAVYRCALRLGLAPAPGAAASHLGRN